MFASTSFSPIFLPLIPFYFFHFLLFIFFFPENLQKKTSSDLWAQLCAFELTFTVGARWCNLASSCKQKGDELLFVSPQIQTGKFGLILLVLGGHKCFKRSPDAAAQSHSFENETNPHFHNICSVNICLSFYFEHFLYKWIVFVICVALKLWCLVQ